MGTDKKIEDIHLDYIKTLEKGHARLLQKYNIILSTMGKIGSGLKEVKDIISDTLSKVLKS